MSDQEEWEAWSDHIITEVIPKMADSAVIMSLHPKGPTDIKFACELGLSIMLDKPILGIVPTGTEPSAKYKAVCDIMITGDPGDPDFNARLMDAIQEMKHHLDLP